MAIVSSHCIFLLLSYRDYDFCFCRFALFIFLEDVIETAEFEDEFFLRGVECNGPKQKL
jgi:hypothetical protein